MAVSFEKVRKKLFRCRYRTAVVGLNGICSQPQYLKTDLFKLTVYHPAPASPFLHLFENNFKSSHAEIFIVVKIISIHHHSHPMGLLLDAHSGRRCGQIRIILYALSCMHSLNLFK